MRHKGVVVDAFFYVVFDMGKFRNILLFIVCLMSSLVVCGQDFDIELFPHGVTGAIANDKYKEKIYAPKKHWGWMTKTAEPEIYVYLPDKAIATGAAVVICPGGGYRLIAINKEGHEIAKAFAERGVAGIVLKYRLPSDAIMSDKSIGPLQDAQEAIREVRRHADEWNIDVDKIGIMGFSAGGHLATLASTHYTDKIYDDDGTSAKPDFVVPVYPVITMDMKYTHRGSREHLLGLEPTADEIDRFSNEKNVDMSTPPTFLVHSKDDKVVDVENSILYFEVLQKNNVPSKIYLYTKGGHGFGVKNRKSDVSWIDLSLDWLREMGVI